MDGKRDARRPRIGRDDRASALIICIAVLSILALLAMSFATLMRVERNASRNLVSVVQARFAAHAGVERSIQELQVLMTQPLETTAMRYSGEDWNDDGALQPTEDVDFDGSLDVDTCPLGQALRPSFHAKDGAGAPDLIPVDGAMRGYSGFLPGPYGKGNHFVLRVRDCNASIDVNMNAGSLARILNSLGARVGAQADIGDIVVASRPAGGYASLDQLEAACSAWEASITRILPFLVTRAWADENVVKPRRLSERLGHAGAPGAARQVLALDQNVYARDSLNPVVLELEPRSPIDINSAPPEVLYAVLLGLAGFYVEEIPGGPVGQGTVGWGMNYGWMDTNFSYSSGDGGRTGVLRETLPISDAQARTIASDIVSNRRMLSAPPFRGPFGSWEQFGAFVGDLVTRGVIDALQGEVLRANFNPNTSLNDFNPDQVLFKRVDKSDLTAYSTEFCFGPMGYFKINSLGRVLGPTSELLAEVEIATEVRAFHVYRETTQRDFLREWLATGDLSNTFSDNNGLTQTAGGRSLQAYPELMDPSYVRDADYDGYLALATVETRDGAGNRRNLFRASFSASSFQAERAGGSAANIADDEGPYSDKMVPGSGGGSVSGHPGDLQPDGAYSERYSSLFYPGPGNFKEGLPLANPESRRGVLSLWVKPNFDPLKTSKIHQFFSINRYHNTASWYNPTPFTIIVFPVSPWNIVDNGPYDYGPQCKGQIGWGLAYKVAFPGSDWVMTGHCTSGNDFYRLEPHRWTHFVALWDLDRPTPETAVTLYINGKKCPGGNHFSFGGSDRFPLRGTIDYTYNRNSGNEPNHMRFGGQWDDQRFNNVADATLDEIVIWADPDASRGLSEALDQWDEGRYYREDDASFTSGEIDVATLAGLTGGSPVRLGTISWTHYLPDTLPDAAVTARIHDGADWVNATYTEETGSVIEDLGGTPVWASGPIRYRIEIDPGVGLNDDILETPILDDVTITFAGDCQILSWTELVAAR